MLLLLAFTSSADITFHKSSKLNIICKGDFRHKVSLTESFNPPPLPPLNGQNVPNMTQKLFVDAPLYLVMHFQVYYQVQPKLYHQVHIKHIYHSSISSFVHHQVHYKTSLSSISITFGGAICDFLVQLQAYY